MTLVLKNNTVTGGVEKLYRDALVSNGTLTLVDFSNLGTLDNYYLPTVRDLAFESKLDLNLNNKIEFKVHDRSVVPSLNFKKGFKTVNLGSYSETSYDSGLNIYNIDDYLFNNQPNSLIVLWLDCSGNEGTESTANQALIKSGDTGMENIRLTGGEVDIFSLRFGGLGFSNYKISNQNAVQIAIEFLANGIPNKLYVNGRYHGEATSNSYGFKPASNPISIGSKRPAVRSIFNFYRFFIEDLNISGRSALDVVAKDYEYVNAINQYEGIEKRPFANL